MQYKAEIDCDGVSAYAFEECAAATVRSTTWTKSPALASPSASIAPRGPSPHCATKVRGSNPRAGTG